MRLATFAVAVLFFRSGTLRAVAAPSVHVYPSGATIPEQLLRVSLVFAQPQDRTIADDVRLRAKNGSLLPTPFVDPPLWSIDGRTLTLLLDPARQKLGLADHRAFGFVLRANERVQLMLGTRVIKSWDVRAGTCVPLRPQRWSRGRVRAGQRDALVVRFSGPIDVLSRSYIAVAAPNGSRIAGVASLANGERTWTFVPSSAWRSGDRLAIHPRFEDPCGNEIGEPFEHAPGAGLGSERTTTFVPLAINNARR